MRPRKKKNLPQRLEACHALLEQDPPSRRGKWQSAFPGEAGPLFVELGCGKGTFVCQMALRHPEHRFVAMEKVPDVLVMAIEQAMELGLSNVRFVSGDAAEICDYFAPGEISGLFINFCDPWHKNRHAKRRLTYRAFLGRYAQVLAPDAEIRFKTDNAPLFEFSLPEFEAAGYVLYDVTHDLHSLNEPDNIVTEYEAAWSEKGYPIHRLVAKKK